MKTALQCLVVLLLLLAAGGAGLAAAQDKMDAAVERSIAFECENVSYSDPFSLGLTEDVICTIGDPARWKDYSYSLLDDREILSDTAWGEGNIIQSQDHRAWLLVLDNLEEHIKDEVRAVIHEDDALWAWGTDMNGYYFVNVVPGMEISDARMAEIYLIIERHAVETGLYDKIGVTPADMPIPLYFSYHPLPIAEPQLEPAKNRRRWADNGITIPEQPEYAVAWNPATDRTGLFRPVVGGCKVSVRTTGGEVYAGTVCCAARDSSGKKGYIVSKHLVRNSQYSLKSSSVYQPHPDTSDAKAGTVTAVGGSYADVAFVAYNDVKAAILHANNSQVSIKGTSEPGYQGMPLYMSGMVTPLSMGPLSQKVDSIDNPALAGSRTLYNQWRASYHCSGGDSGAPIYTGVKNTRLVGIHWGHDNLGYSYLSPTSGITGDLGVTILTS